MKRALTAVALVAATFGGATAANAANILTNGSFEAGIAANPLATVAGGDSTSITGWTVGGAGVDLIGSFWAAQDGTRSLDLASIANGSVSQTFATVAGTVYNVSYWIARNPQGGINPRTGSVSINGGAAPVSFTNATTDTTNMGWINLTTQFTATAATSTITFASTNGTDGFGLALDNVSVEAATSAVPEPATWLMMIAGFGLIGAGMRRKRSSLAFA